MLMTKLKIMGLVLVLLVLGACTPDTAVPVTIPPTRTLVATETGTAVAQTPPTTPTFSPTPAPTQTPTPTNTLQPAPRTWSTPTPIIYDLPAWIVDPDANVLLVRYYGEPYGLAVSNADTGERHGINVLINDPAPTWVWREGNYFIGPVVPRGVEEFIDMKTGELVEMSEAKQDVLSPDGRYVTHIKQEDRFDIVTLMDQETGLETELYNPFQDSSRDDYNIYARTHWSPDGTLLAVVYEKHYYDDNSDRGLAIYTASGELFRQYANMHTSWNNPWSPVLPHRILYIEGGRPCILDVIENNQTCLETIAEWVENQNVWPYNFIWSPDGSKISFVHISREERMNNNGVCYIELTTEEIFCPITPDDLQLEELMYPRVHFWSPDGRYLSLFFDNHGLGDVVGPLGMAVVNSDDQNPQISGREFSWPYSNPWRPSIPSQSEE